jgi:hypothetical protein
VKDDEITPVKDRKAAEKVLVAHDNVVSGRDRRERAEAIVALRALEWSWARIGELLGVDRANAQKMADPNYWKARP